MGDTFGTPVYSAGGVIAAPHYLASLAGADVLRDGGSAVDAAIAANLVLGVVWPQMCGPGGDLFAQVWSGPERRLFGLNASGRAGSGMTLEAYQAQGLDRMPTRGALSVTVPGAVGGWFALHERFGRLEMSRLARDAIQHARDGFRVTPFVSSAIHSNAALLAQMGGGAEVFLPGGRAPLPGDRLQQPDLARTLEQLVREGPTGMYSGSLGERLVEFLSTRGSLLQTHDFPAQQSEWVEPLSVDYRGVRVCQLPPNSQGVALLQMLNMLAETDLTAWEPIRPSSCTSSSSARSWRSPIATPSSPTRPAWRCQSTDCSTGTRLWSTPRVSDPAPRRRTARSLDARWTATRCTCAPPTATGRWSA